MQESDHLGYAGFTLVEILVTLAVSVIVLTAAVPSFRDVIRNSRLTAATNDLVTAVNLARSEAIKRGVRVTMCKSPDGTACSSTNGWDQGWIIFTDADGDAAYTAGSDELLRVQDSVGPNVALNGAGSVADYVSFVPRGHGELLDGSFQADAIKACDSRTGPYGKNIAIGTSGRVRTERGVACP